MSKALKRMMAAEYTAAINGRDSLLFIDYGKIPANKTRDLRDRLRAKGIHMLVVKNRVFDKTLEDQGVKGFRSIAAGQLAVLYAEQENGAQLAAKVMADWLKETKSGEVRGGMMEGEISGAEDAKNWKDLPSREEMLSILLGQLMSVGANLASQIGSPGANLASQVKERSEGKGDTPAKAE